MSIRAPVGRLRQIALVAVCALTLYGPLIRAQQSTAQDQPRPTFRTEANYIRVDVYATARDGMPVTDLRREDFELLEDRVPQAIDQFFPIEIRTANAPVTRSDPRTPEDSRQAATEPRARVFVLFLDVLHVDGIASQRIATPLTNAIRRLIGPDDLIAIVDPHTPTRAITFTRQIETVESALRRAWGARDRDDLIDDVERRYAQCYPGLPRKPDERVAPDLGIAQEMILRRREDQTFDALEELITYLRDTREERKAVITITNGWRVYAPNQTLTRAIDDQLPSAPRAGFDPRTGKLSSDPLVTNQSGSACDSDRLRLAQLDHTQRYRQMLDSANRANVSFYPVDPRGIVVFDDDIVPVAGVGQNPTISPVEDNRRLGERHTALRTMAESTDGVAVLDTNNFAPALQRMTADLTSYYLLGYYSTGKLDGRFHAITVRVKRPGVQIRARRGYLAANTVTTPPLPAAESAISAAAETRAVSNALATLSAVGKEPSVFVQAAFGWSAPDTPAVWTVVELPRATSSVDWSKGGEADVLLIDPTGNTAGSSRVTLAPAGGGVRAVISPRALVPGSYEVRVRARGVGAAATANESIRVTVPSVADGAGVMFFRRGPTTGNKEVPTADLRFRRSDTLRLLIPASPAMAAGSARLLDRTGKELAVRVTVMPSQEPDGSKWLSGQAALAPLAPGDYLIEIVDTTNGAQRRTLTAFRVVP
ncbi:MAG TPA: VWA domain-containing protein [Vicinamibacterales bacterium]|nr:VWA domain-containing protein [Vicinamibacterales bacterium]